MLRASPTPRSSDIRLTHSRPAAPLTCDVVDELTERLVDALSHFVGEPPDVHALAEIVDVDALIAESSAGGALRLSTRSSWLAALLSEGRDRAQQRRGQLFELLERTIVAARDEIGVEAVCVRMTALADGSSVATRVGLSLHIQESDGVARIVRVLMREVV